MTGYMKPKKAVLKSKSTTNAPKKSKFNENNFKGSKVESTYKDRIFRMIFKDKKEFLSLYNAMNDSSYSNLDDLTVTTLENAIYMGMRNDVSFLLYDKLMLYEHQSTRNPNIPLRNLFYVSDIYSNLTKDMNLFGTKRLQIPEPKFIVFYNGVAKAPECETIRLSDLFGTSSISGSFTEQNQFEHAALRQETLRQVSLELITQVFNINLGYNKSLMEKCKTLHDYAVFVDLVRRYRKELPLETAVKQAIDECVANDVLADFLRANRAEVMKMGLYEYDEEAHIRMEREDAWEEGHEQGCIEGQLQLISIIRKKYLKQKDVRTIADELELEAVDIESIYELVSENPAMDDNWIARQLLKQ